MARVGVCVCMCRFTDKTYSSKLIIWLLYYSRGEWITLQQCSGPTSFYVLKEHSWPCSVDLIQCQELNWVSHMQDTSFALPPAKPNSPVLWYWAHWLYCSPNNWSPQKEAPHSSAVSSSSFSENHESISCLWIDLLRIFGQKYLMSPLYHLLSHSTMVSGSACLKLQF